MPAQIKINFEGIKELSSKMGALKANLSSSLESQVGRVIDEASKVASSEAPSATGELKDSFKKNYGSNSSGFYGELIVGADYAFYVEHGRTPGGAPPTDKIRTWLSAKGMDTKAAYLIARKIGRGGTKANPFLKRTFDIIKPDILRKVTAAVVIALNGTFK